MLPIIEIRETSVKESPITEVIGGLIRDIAKAKVVGIEAKTRMDIVLAYALLASTKEKVEMLDKLGMLSADECDNLEAYCDATETRIKACEMDIKRAKRCRI